MWNHANTCKPKKNTSAIDKGKYIQVIVNIYMLLSSCEFTAMGKGSSHCEGARFSFKMNGIVTSKSVILRLLMTYFPSHTNSVFSTNPLNSVLLLSLSRLLAQEQPWVCAWRWCNGSSLGPAQFQIRQHGAGKPIFPRMLESSVGYYCESITSPLFEQVDGFHLKCWHCLSPSYLLMIILDE